MAFNRFDIEKAFILLLAMLEQYRRDRTLLGQTAYHSRITQDVLTTEIES